MKRTLAVSLFATVVLALIVGPAMAGKPSTDGVFNGNGFPSGPHYNLNIIAKKAEFLCPEQEYYLRCPDDVTLVKDCSDCPGYEPGVTVCVETEIPIYGGVIFVPQEPGSDDITILMESGTKGPKKKQDAAVTALEVTGWCAETFDGNPAAFRLPANEDGYAVYARVTGDPKQNPQFDFINPRLKYVMDENGNDLLLLGFITNSLFDSYGEELPSRYDSSGKGKGVQKAVEITPLLMYTGDVCYIGDNDLLEYCCEDVNANGVCDPGEEICDAYDYCCLDADGDGDYEHCDPLSDFGDVCPADPVDLCCVDTDFDVPGYEYCDLFGDVESGGYCPLYFDYFGEDLEYTEVDGIYYQSVTAWCKHYESKWVFNIADFVGLLFDIDGPSDSGASVIQVRFYPLPLNTK